MGAGMLYIFAARIGVLVALLGLVFVLLIIAGESARLWPGCIQTGYDKLKVALQDHGATLELFGKAAGVVTTLLSGSWAIYKSWWYSERNLPKRLAEFLERNDDRLRSARPLLLENIEAPNPNRSIRTPITFVGPLNLALGRIRLGKVDKAQELLNTSIERLRTQQELCKDYDKQTARQRVTAHLLRGIAIAARATMATSTDDRQKLDRESFAQFDEAANIDPQDAEALYYRGRQSMRMGQALMASHDLRQAALLAGDGPSIVKARALYANAQIAKEDQAWQTALLRMAACIDACPATFKHCEEYAEMNEFRGTVQENHPNNYMEAARASYRDAAAVFSTLHSERAKNGLSRVNDALGRLSEDD
jgi:tetratricopeptide (TPR) repeat protein